MKLLLMADSHQNYSAVRDVATRHRDEVDAFVHLGDGIREFLGVMKEMDCSNYYFIAGNHEDGTIYNQSPDYEIISINGHRMLITHGDKYENKLDLLGIAHIASMNGAEIALCGHTHSITHHNELSILFVSPWAHSRGIGQTTWKAIEELHPETEVWETYTPYLEKRNINFYVNKCGFHIVEYINPYYKDSKEMYNSPDDFDGMFRFEKRMKNDR